MRFERRGNDIIVNIPSTLNWVFPFTHQRTDEASAEAIMRTLQEHADKQAMYASNRVWRLEHEVSLLKDYNRRLKRQVQYHKRQARKHR